MGLTSLKQAADFQKLLRHCFSFKTKFFVVYACRNQLKQPRLGMMIAKRFVKKAVSRNKIKRQIREQTRRANMPPLDILVRMHQKVDDTQLDEVKQQVNYLCEKLLKKASAN